MKSVRSKNEKLKSQKVDTTEPIKELGTLEHLDEVKSLLVGSDQNQQGNAKTLKTFVHHFKSVNANQKMIVTINDCTKLNPQKGFTEEEKVKFEELSNKLKEVETKLFSENVTKVKHAHFASNKNIPFYQKVEFMRTFFKKLCKDEAKAEELNRKCELLSDKLSSLVSESDAILNKDYSYSESHIQKVKQNMEVLQLMIDYQSVVKAMAPFFKYADMVTSLISTPIETQFEITNEQIDQTLTTAAELKGKITGNMNELAKKVSELESLIKSK